VLTKDDLKEIGLLLGPLKKILDFHSKELGGIRANLNNHSKEIGEIRERLDINNASTMKIEGKIDSALELRLDVNQVKKQVNDHEARISNLEKFPKI